MLTQDSRLKFPVSGDRRVLLFPNAGSVPSKEIYFLLSRRQRRVRLSLFHCATTQNNQYAIEVHFGAACPGPQSVCVCLLSITAVVLNQEFLCRLKVVYLAWFVVKMYFWPNKMFVRGSLLGLYLYQPWVLRCWHFI